MQKKKPPNFCLIYLSACPVCRISARSFRCASLRMDAHIVHPPHTHTSTNAATPCARALACSHAPRRPPPQTRARHDRSCDGTAIIALAYERRNLQAGEPFPLPPSLISPSSPRPLARTHTQVPGRPPPPHPSSSSSSPTPPPPPPPPPSLSLAAPPHTLPPCVHAMGDV
jgi:hypothetical protein